MLMELFVWSLIHFQVYIIRDHPASKKKENWNVVYWSLFPARIQAVYHPGKSVNSLNEFELFDTNEYETKSQ